MSKLRAFCERNWVLIIGAVAIVPFIAISFFNHPSSDDYCYTVQSIKLGFCKAQLSTYNEWSGRYFATAILSINPLAFGWMNGYKVLPIIILTLFISSLFYLIKALCPTDISIKEALNITAVIAVLYLYRTKEVVSAFYWMAASTTYQLGTILAILSFASLSHLFVRDGKNKKLYFTLSLLFLVGTIGSNETIMFIVYLLLLAIFISNYLTTKRISHHLILILIIASFASIFVYAAPGNEMRFQHEAYISKNPEIRHNLSLSLSSSAMTAASYCITWLRNFTIIMFTVLYIPYGIRMSERTLGSNNPFSIRPALSLVGFLIIFVLSFFPSYWATNRLEGRVINVIYLYFLIGWFFNVQVIIHYLNQKRIMFKGLSHISSVLIVILILIKLSTGGNIRNAYKDLIKGNAYRYDKEVSLRYKKIHNCRETICELERISDHPSTLFWDDITSDETHWVNQCVGDYFNKTLRLKTSL